MIFTDTLALTSNGAALIQFENSHSTASSTIPMPRATNINPQEMRTDLKVAYWGGDNMYPQNVTESLSTCGVARSALDFKARVLYGNGIIHGTITGYDDKGNEIFEAAQPGSFPEVEAWLAENDHFYRFFLEFNQDWVQFGNCFPELIFSNDRKRIARIVHQESSDCRYKQMNDKGVIDRVYLSKFWGEISQQFVKANADDHLKVSPQNKKQKPKDKVDNDVIKELRALDMYNAYEDLVQVAQEGKENSVILPVNYPSTGKTYYQSPVWDAVRLSGWMDIASKIPQMLKSLYTNAFNLKYHIQIPDEYFKDNIPDWTNLDIDAQRKHKQKMVESIEQFLSGANNSYKSLITFFKINPHDKKEYGLIKITPIDNKSSVDKELLLSSSINQEILFAMQINPNIIGAGAPGGAYTGGAGSGSDIREAFLTYCASLYLERKIILEPIRLAAKFNGFDPKLVFRFRDIVLTTLDQNSGTKKVIS